MVDENGGHKEMSREEIEDRSKLERALALLKPPASSIDRDSFLFLAGRASVETVRLGGPFGQWIWPAATFLSGLAAIVLAVVLVTRPAAAPVDLPLVKSAPVTSNAIVDTNVPPPTDEAIPESSPNAPDQQLALSPPSRDEAARDLASGTNYPRVRSYVLAYGIDALPDPAPIRGQSLDDQPRSQHELLRAFLQDHAAVKTSTHSAG
jgi:hypothetical protein